MRAEGLGHAAFDNVAPFEKGKEDILGHPRVILGAGGGKEVEGDAQLLPALQKLLVEAAGNLLGRFSLLLGPQGDWGAVLVAPRDHEHLVALGPVVAGKDVRR